VGGAEGTIGEPAQLDPRLLLSSSVLAGNGGHLWVGAGLIATATLLGAAVARSPLARAARVLVVVAGVLLVVVTVDLVPDIVRDLPGSGMPWWGPVLAAASAAAVAGGTMRRGCACRPASPRGPWTAVAIGIHRALEGATLAVSGSLVLIAALVLHAAGEGFALSALLRGVRRRTAALWLLVGCVSPAVGATALGSGRIPDSVRPVVTAAVAGVLLRIAFSSYRIVTGSGQQPEPHPCTRSELTEQVAVRVDDDSHDGVAAGRAGIGSEHDRGAIGRQLDRPRDESLAR
jgi:ZIP family zinc transporter